MEEGDYFQGDYLEEDKVGELESSLTAVGAEEGDYLEKDKEGELESSLPVVGAEEVSLKVLGAEEEG